jgi:DNA-binding NarL/FixJ family response regulator
MDLVERIAPQAHEVLRLLGEGRTNREIGERLGISEKTIHRAAIIRRTGLKTRPALVIESLRRKLVRLPRISPARTALSPREEQMLRLFAGNLKKATVGAALGISEKTVEVHVANIARKTGVRDATELTYFALRYGYATLPTSVPGPSSQVEAPRRQRS